MTTGTRNRIEWAAWSAVGVAAILLVLFGLRLSEPDPELAASPLVGQPAAQLVLPRIDGGEFDFADADGTITVVNFWASWCVPCRDEHPELVAAANGLDGEVQFVGITYLDALDDAREFLDEYGRAEAAAYVQDPGSRAAIEYGIFGIPETFVIDETGTIVGVVRGPVNLPLILNTVEQIRSGENPGVTETGETFSG